MAGNKGANRSFRASFVRRTRTKMCATGENASSAGRPCDEPTGMLPGLSSGRLSLEASCIYAKPRLGASSIVPAD